MTTKADDIFVSHIGINRVNLGGRNVDTYTSYPNTETIDRVITVKGSERLVRTVILSFGGEREMVAFLQLLVNQGICFADNLKSVAYMEACNLKAMGKLKGEILGC